MCRCVHSGWCWNGKCLRMVHVVYVSIYIYSSQHQKGLHLHVHGEEGLLSGQLCNWHVKLPFSCQCQHYS